MKNFVRILVDFQFSHNIFPSIIKINKKILLMTKKAKLAIEQTETV